MAESVDATDLKGLSPIWQTRLVKAFKFRGPLGVVKRQS